MDLGLTDRVLLVTGAGAGLGRATLEVLRAEGARVVASGRSEEGLAALRADHDGDDGLVTLVADNADPATPGRLLEVARERWGRVDGALVSVGGPPAGAVTAMSDEQWTAAFSSVFLGAVRLCREVGTALAGNDDGGALALVLSTSVRSPIGDLAISNGLRPGLAMVAKQLADELGPDGVRVNGLLPGRVETERVRWLDAQSGDAEAARAGAVSRIPLRRYGRPEEFGRVAAFLLSPAASFVSGTMVPVDGGMTRAL